MTSSPSLRHLAETTLPTDASLVAGAPLQLSSDVRLLADATALLSLALALVIAYQAFRGYRRNDSRPMLWLSVGFVLMVVFPISLNFALRELFTRQELLRHGAVVVATSRAGTLSGLVCIVYSLYSTGE